MAFFKRGGILQFDEFGPEKIVEVYDPKTKMRGFTVIDNTALGPGKGGIRMTETVSVEEVFKLARTMTWKNSMAGLPFGGAKSGIVFDPKKHSLEEKRKVIEAFGRAIRIIAPEQYIAAPDINMAEEEMRWLVTANGSKKSATGKPADLGGIPHELGSTGFGIYHAALVALKHLKKPVEETTVAIEGFGNVGAFAAKYLAEKGAKIVAVSDSKGTLYNEKGIDFKKLEKVKQEQGTVTKYGQGKVLSTQEIVELPAFLLITAAVPDLINEKNYSKVKASLIVEGSNIPMTHDVEEKLSNKGILIVPDFVANAGGVISSYVEHIGGTKEQMFKMVEEKITKNTKEVLENPASKKCPRCAAVEIAKKRVQEAMGKRRE